MKNQNSKNGADQKKATGKKELSPNALKAIQKLAEENTKAKEEAAAELTVETEAVEVANRVEKPAKDKQKKEEVQRPKGTYCASEGYHYYLSVKPSKPEIRDAIALLSFSTREDEFSKKVNTSNKLEEEEVQQLLESRARLFGFIYKNGAILRPFFYYSLTYHVTILKTLLYNCIWKLDLSAEEVLAEVASFKDEELFCTLLMYLHKHMRFPTDILEHVVRDRERFLLFMDGAGYAEDIKRELIALYEACNLGQEGKIPTLKNRLVWFLRDYYEEFKKEYELLQPIIDRELDKIKGQIARYKCLPNATEGYIFNRMLQKGHPDKIVTVEHMAFSYESVAYTATNSWIILNLGYHYYNYNNNDADSMEHFGEKLKPIAEDNTKRLLDLLHQNPCNFDTVMEKLQISKDAAYRLTNTLLKQNIIFKDEENGNFQINQQHLRKLRDLLERHGKDAEKWHE